jgi:D-erythro-7,8-dihydroneopterin triphosphate epimerase
MEFDMDRIFIRDLALRCIIGIFPEERREKQDIVINVEMHCDLRKAGASDDLSDTVDYKTIKKAILKLVEASHFQLIESLAEKIASIALDNEKVQQVVVTIDKPGALRFAKASAVEITRKR